MMTALKGEAGDGQGRSGGDAGELFCLHACRRLLRRAACICWCLSACRCCFSHTAGPKHCLAESLFCTTTRTSRPAAGSSLRRFKHHGRPWTASDRECRSPTVSLPPSLTSRVPVGPLVNSAPQQEAVSALRSHHRLPRACLGVSCSAWTRRPWQAAAICETPPCSALAAR